MRTSRQTRWAVGVVAALATLLTAGGPLMLAEHYAQSGPSWDASVYHATAQTRRVACSPDVEPRTTAVLIRHARKTPDAADV